MHCIGRLVKVTAKSNKGRNRIAEHGDIWLVKKQWGNQLLIETGEDNGNGLHWVYGIEDPDFALKLI